MAESIFHVFFQIVVALLLLGRASTGRPGAEDSSVPASSKNGEYPDGYFPFEESPSRTPPKVRRPPYAQADVDCPGIFYKLIYYFK